MDNEREMMKVNVEKLGSVLKRIGAIVQGDYVQAEITVGEVDGVVFRVVAIDAMKAEDEDCADGPEWAQCVTRA